MMKNGRWLASGLFLLASVVFSENVLAVPAAPIVHELIQPDGSRFQAKKWGDEWNHGWETVEGYTIVQEAATKSWVYATSDADGKMVPTARTVGADAVLLNTPKYLRPAESSSSKALRMSAEAQPLAAAAVAPTGTANIPVILVNFSDTSTTYTTNDFSSLLFGTGNHSMKDYYEEVSYGKFSVSAGPAGVRGWYKASKTHDYYGANEKDSEGKDIPGSDQNIKELLLESVKAADADVDFSQYDSDGDCFVDVVAIVHQGKGEETSTEEDSNDIWSKRLSFENPLYTTDDTAKCGSIKVKDFIIQPEIYQGGLTTMGVFAHEYGHSLGLPDLYDTDDSSQGIGNWCLMAAGSWNKTSRDGDRPAHISAWGKYKLGWVNPTVVIGKLENEQISAASNQADVYRLLTGSPGTGGEYFLIENRQQSDFDEGLPGAGLAIWHIDESKATPDNTDNTQECKNATGCPTAHYRVALEQADGLFHLENNKGRGNAGDLYASGQTFTSSTVPNSLLYGGTDHKLSVTNISASGSVMTATIDVSNYYHGRLGAGGHTFFIQNDGSLWAWGNNYAGQLGDGTAVDDKYSPIRIGIETNWSAIKAGGSHTLAIKRDGSLWAWGNNETGQVGDGTTDNKYSPVQIGTDTNWQVIAAGHLHSAAVKSDGSLWVWGWNYSGQLGDGTTEDKHSPIRIGTENNWQSVATGNMNTLALKRDGSLWAWGLNDTGQLGDGTTQERHSPVRVGTDRDWQHIIAVGLWHTVALKSDGSLWAWGSNGTGSLGDGTTEDKHSPVQIGVSDDWQIVVAKDAHNLALKNNNTLWTWGWNALGQLGDGTKNNQFSPTPLGTDADWMAVAAGYDYSVALKSDGSLWAWGHNNDGQLGIGNKTETDRLTPVRVIFPSNSDTDNDGIDDGWEMTYFHNLTAANATSDIEKDGYSDKQEYLNWLAGEQDPNSAVYDPTAKNAPGGTGYQPPGKASFLPAIYKLLLKR